MIGKNAQYVEHRGVNATPDYDREIRMEGDEAVYLEYVYGQPGQQTQQQQEPADETEEERKLLSADGEYIEPMNEKELTELAELFKVFGDSTRARIICALSISELCVCDLACILNMTQSAISHQLRILKQARMVKNRRAGKSVYYSLDDEHIRQLFDIAFEHVMED